MVSRGELFCWFGALWPGAIQEDTDPGIPNEQLVENQQEAGNTEGDQKEFEECRSGEVLDPILRQHHGREVRHVEPVGCVGHVANPRRIRREA